MCAYSMYKVRAFLFVSPIFYIMMMYFRCPTAHVYNFLHISQNVSSPFIMQILICSSLMYITKSIKLSTRKCVFPSVRLHKYGGDSGVVDN